MPFCCDECQLQIDAADHCAACGALGSFDDLELCPLCGEPWQEPETDPQL